MPPLRNVVSSMRKNCLPADRRMKYMSTLSVEAQIRNPSPFLLFSGSANYAVNFAIACGVVKTAIPVFIAPNPSFL